MADLRAVWPVGHTPSDDISIYEGPQVFMANYAAARVKERTVFAAYWLQAEVLNGGLLQFFSNDTGVLAPEAVAACHAFSMPALAKATEQAMAWFGSPCPRERETRQATIASYLNTHVDGADPFEALDAEIADLIYDENGGIELAASHYLGVVGSS
jgi:hypothetical protein